MSKNTIDISELLHACSIVSRANRIDIKRARFVLNGNELNVPATVREEFDFTGLNTSDFVKMGLYKRKRTIWQKTR